MTARTVAGAGHERSELGLRLPLATPLSLHIFPSARCNFRCGYCIHSLPAPAVRSMGYGRTLLDLELFTKCVDDAARFDEPLKALIFAGWGEPLTHPRIVEMVALAKRAGIAERVEIVSNGALLTRLLADALIEAGLDRLRISIQGLSSDACSEVAGVTVDLSALVDSISYFHARRGRCRVYVKTVDAAAPTPADRDRFRQLFDAIADELAVEQIIPVNRQLDHSRWRSRFDQRHCGGDAAAVTVCPFPFYVVVVHADGAYAPCCSAERPLALGNVRDTSLVELWRGQRLRRFRVGQLEGTRGRIPACQACNRPRYDLQPGDDLDPYARRLLPAYRSTQLLRSCSATDEATR
jgi:MoaA/NifB/PqqE/SkfB family radical SAM enzyme